MIVKKIPNKFLVNICLFFISLLISLGGGFLLAEKFFFDKLFYRKSVIHGYDSEDVESLEDFGERSRDLVEYNFRLSQCCQSETVLGSSDQGVENDSDYMVAIIGDSYVWGAGVRYSKTLVNQLSKRLNRFRTTRVLSLAHPGDSILDYLARYEHAEQFYNIDLYIFVLVSNDALLSKSSLNKNDFNGIAKRCQEKNGNSLLIFDADWKNLDFTMAKDRAGEVSDLSWESDANVCVVDESLKKLPHDSTKAIYFVTDNYFADDYYWQQYLNILESHNVNLISSRRGMQMPKYFRYWENPYRFFQISKKESHPSTLAHKMYAEILYQEILNNNIYKFLH